jgi:thiamine biosynthesis lipoprotein
MNATTRTGPGRALAAAAALTIAMGTAATAGIGTPHSVTYPAHTMGTYVHVVLVTADSAAAGPDAMAALHVFSHTDSLMSNWTSTSEVARINREAAAATTVVEPEVARVIARSLEVWRQSDGAFDITVEPLVRAWGFIGGKPHVPTDAEAAAAFRHVGARHLRFDAEAGTLRFDEDGVRIDLGGIAKGYAVDVAAESLRARGVRDALVDLTGNMLAMGHPADAAGWRIGLRDPRDRMPYFARLQLHDEGISTSGKYEQYVAAGGIEVVAASRQRQKPAVEGDQAGLDLGCAEVQAQKERPARRHLVRPCRGTEVASSSATTASAVATSVTSDCTIPARSAPRIGCTFPAPAATPMATGTRPRFRASNAITRSRRAGQTN